NAEAAAAVVELLKLRPGFTVRTGTGRIRNFRQSSLPQGIPADCRGSTQGWVARRLTRIRRWLTTSRADLAREWWRYRRQGCATAARGEHQAPWQSSSSQSSLRRYWSNGNSCERDLDQDGQEQAGDVLGRSPRDHHYHHGAGTEGAARRHRCRVDTFG